jgi:hypothetical protein
VCTITRAATTRSTEIVKDEDPNPWNFLSPFTAAALAGTSRLNWLLVVEGTVIYENTDIWVA